MPKKISCCRICRNRRLTPLLDLGQQCLTGIFPKSKTEVVPSGPLELVKCDDSEGADACGLVQLRHSYESHELYGENYGYRSGLNASMVRHLGEVLQKNLRLCPLKKGDLVVDIGSNDGTLLKMYPQDGINLVGIDPSALKFKQYYPENIQILPFCFTSALLKENFPGKKAKIITSIAMFYDLEDPFSFAEQIKEVLDDEGIWVLEQSYLPSMLSQNAYDTICHEHIEYYALKQILWMFGKLGLKIVDCELNDINGGSFKLIVMHKNSKIPEGTSQLNGLLELEKKMELDTLKPFKAFEQSVKKHRGEMRRLIQKLQADQKKIIGYGASTKGNVILQYCGFTEKEIPFIAEVNEDKFGCFTPKTLIPIISEKEAKAMSPESFLVFPWHFREFILEKEKAYLQSGGEIIFPLPAIETVRGT